MREESIEPLSLLTRFLVVVLLQRQTYGSGEINTHTPGSGFWPEPTARPVGELSGEAEPGSQKPPGRPCEFYKKSVC
jgi:hypothetical protein